MGWLLSLFVLRVLVIVVLLLLFVVVVFVFHYWFVVVVAVVVLLLGFFCFFVFVLFFVPCFWLFWVWGFCYLFFLFSFLQQTHYQLCLLLAFSQQ